MEFGKNCYWLLPKRRWRPGTKYLLRKWLSTFLFLGKIYPLPQSAWTATERFVGHQARYAECVMYSITLYLITIFGAVITCWFWRTMKMKLRDVKVSKEWCFRALDLRDKDSYATIDKKSTILGQVSWWEMRTAPSPREKCLVAWYLTFHPLNTKKQSFHLKIFS